MNVFASILTFLFFVGLLEAAPLATRAILPSSPVFSLVAQHRGAHFKYNLVKFDGTDLVLNADEAILFGRIQGNNGYTLNIPYGNYTTNATNPPTSSVITAGNRTLVPPLSVSVFVDKTNLLSVASNNTASPDFGILNSLLTYRNSTQFLACPYYEPKNLTFASNYTANWGNSTSKWSEKNSTLAGHYNGTHHNGTHHNSTYSNATVPYHIYFRGDKNSTKCPLGAAGYDITLLVQVSETVNYSPTPRRKRFYFF